LLQSTVLGLEEFYSCLGPDNLQKPYHCYPLEDHASQINNPRIEIHTPRPNWKTDGQKIRVKMELQKKSMELLSTLF
jgi:hypothetical protein